MATAHPYGREQVELLNRLWCEAADRHLAPEDPYVPVVGNRYDIGSPRPRLMFVGKAPFGFQIDTGSYPWTLEQMLRQATMCFEERGNRPFFQFQDLCMQAVLSVPHDSLGRQYGVSTNLMKIGRPPARRGNPAGSLADLQRDSCKELLEFEIRALNPTGIVFLTNEYELGLVEKIVWGAETPEWNDVSPAVSIATRGQARVYRLYHPDWMMQRRPQLGLVEKAIAIIAADQK